MNKPEQTPADFELMQKILAEYKATGRSASADRWLGATKSKLDAYRAAGGIKVKKECDAVEAGLQRTIELIELLRSGTVRT